jgi:4-amino-4-deoxy-L-arabinose transferase-like glycosyltransferase
MTRTPLGTRILLLVLLIAVFGVELGAVGLFEKDEGRYTQSAREMRRSGDFLVPTLRGEPRLNKPPLLYWLIAAGQETLGENEFTARLPSAICGVLISLLVFTIARRLAGHQAGFFAALVYATSGYGLGMGRLAHPESLLVLGVTGAVVCFYLAWREGFEHRRTVVFMWLFAGLGFMGKGPHAILLPALIAFVFLLLRKDLKATKRLMLVRGLLVAIAPVAIWGGITVATEGRWVAEMWLDETVGRVSGARSYHPEPFWFFAPKLLAGFAPWTLWLPLTVAVFRRKNDRPAGGLFLLVWAAVPFLFFSASANKAAAYMLSVIPPLAVATGIGLARLAAGRALTAMGWFCSLLALAGVGAIAYARFPPYIHVPEAAFLATALLAIAVFVLLAAAALAGRPRLFAFSSTLGLTAIALTGICLLLPSFDPVKSYRIAGNRIRERIQPEDLLANVGTRRAGLVWYSDHEVERELEPEDLPPIWESGRRIFVYGRRKKLAPIVSDPNLRFWQLWEDPKGQYVVLTNFDPF